MSLAIVATPHRTLFLPCHYFRCYPRYSSTSPLLPIAPLPIKSLQPIHHRYFLLGAVVSNIASLLPSPYSFPCHLVLATSTLLFISSIVTATLPLLFLLHYSPLLSLALALAPAAYHRCFPLPRPWPPQTPMPMPAIAIHPLPMSAISLQPSPTTSMTYVPDSTTEKRTEHH
ncbi:hypothetical protein B296_00020706 [Ensete ventricosum]|uniref:Uncharacterized protein n=1 Tax=Ensete ventricosum TaxID=4639 RepID=A0A426ZG74_ENSVE|nr:hypothetical protein B296_00020706 [Ensete ventricosum]